MDEAKCSKCGQLAQFKCERCYEPYCSSQCQVSDWQEHKTKCYKFPDLIPINILKSAYSNLSLDKHVGNLLRSHGSSLSLNSTRRTGNYSNRKARNPVETLEDKGAKPKELLNDDDFNLVPKEIAACNNTSGAKPRCASILTAEKPITWRVAFPPSEGFFDVMVQFIEEVQDEKRILWVTDMKYATSLCKLLAEINRNVNQTVPCNPDAICVGALVAAPLGKILYRAEVLHSSPESLKATVRLIDYGNEVRVSYSQIYAPLPIMSNLNAFAFRICLSKDYCAPVEIESIMNIKIDGPKQADGFYYVECKTKSIALRLPLELLAKEPALTVVKYFSDGRHALLQLGNDGGGVEDLNLDAVLNSVQSISFDFESIPKAGEFVVARTANGWKRARLLGFYEKQYQFLVYTIDEGAISFSPQIKKVPQSFVTQPIRVFSISTIAPDNTFFDTSLSAAKMVTLQLLPATDSMMTKEDEKTKLTCALFSEKRKIMDEVIASVFTGFLNELGLKLWHEKISEGENVFISHVVTYKEVYIASPQNKEYVNIIMSEYQKCSPIPATDTIEQSDVVLCCLNEQNKQYCRGQIISWENNKYKIMNIDNGRDHLLSRDVLRKPTQFVCSLPVRCCLVKLMFLESVPTPFTNNKALEALEACVKNATEFDITYGRDNTADLLFRTKERQSLCQKLLPLVFKNATITTDGKLPQLPLSPPNTPIPPSVVDTLQIQVAQKPEDLGATALDVNKTLTMDDLELIPIVCGEKVPLYVLDPTTILDLDGPYITAADCSNKQSLAKTEECLKLVGQYCRSAKAPKAGYSPKKMEICLSVFADDGEWYRALCVDCKPNDTFVVMFLDYGNISKVNKKDIMPMIPELMFPSNANMVYVEGIKSSDQGLLFIKMIRENPIVYASITRVEETDAYMAKILNLT